MAMNRKRKIMGLAVLPWWMWSISSGWLFPSGGIVIFMQAPVVSCEQRFMPSALLAPYGAWFGFRLAEVDSAQLHGAHPSESDFLRSR